MPHALTDDRASTLRSACEEGHQSKMRGLTDPFLPLFWSPVPNSPFQ